MLEIRWHGRGGQGAFTAARLLGAAALFDGQFALAFPSFGPERRGAPIQAFTRLDGRRIGDRSALRACDFAVVLDPAKPRLMPMPSRKDWPASKLSADRVVRFAPEGSADVSDTLEFTSYLAQSMRMFLNGLPPPRRIDSMQSWLHKTCRTPNQSAMRKIPPMLRGSRMPSRARTSSSARGAWNFG